MRSFNKFIALIIFVFNFKAHAVEIIDVFFDSEIMHSFCKSSYVIDANGVVNKKEVFLKNIGNRIFYSATAKNSKVELNMFDLESGEILNFNPKGKIKDAFMSDSERGRKLNVLTGLGIERFDLTDASTYSLSPSLNDDYQNPTSQPEQAVVVGESVIIAHGDKGLSILDLHTLAQDKHLKMEGFNLNKGSLRSNVTGVSLYEDKLILAIDNVNYDFGTDQRAFEGYVTLSSKDYGVQKITPLDQLKEAYYMPRLQVMNNLLLMQNMHIFQIFTKNDLQKKMAQPSARRYFFDKGEILGVPIIQNNKFYGCFVDPRGDVVKIVSGSASVM